MTDREEPTPEAMPLEVLSDTEPPSTSAGRVWVPTAIGLFGQLEDWKLVPEEVAADWDVRRWGPLR